MPPRRCTTLRVATDQVQLPQSDAVLHIPNATEQDWAPLEWIVTDDESMPSVVSTALTLWGQQPQLPALEVLDRAMRIHANEDLDFQFDGEDELAPPHPFAELIRRAFAPQLDAIEVCMSFVQLDVEDRELRTRVAHARRCWNRVILRFAERYRLWEPES